MELGDLYQKTSECVLQLDARFICALDCLCSLCQHVSDLEFIISLWSCADEGSFKYSYGSEES